jgi:MraZ protein
VFLGEFQHTVDAKGRVSLPRKHRDEIGPRVVVTQGLDKCLYVFSPDGYHDFVREVLGNSSLGHEARAVQRHFIAGASEVDVDAAGRIAISPALRKFGAISRDVIIAGVADHVEIWDVERWSAYQEANLSTIEDAADKLAARGIL